MGNKQLMHDEGVDLSAILLETKALRQGGQTVLFVAIDNKVAAGYLPSLTH